MRLQVVVILSLALDDHLGFLKRVEDFAVEQLVPELPVAESVVAVLLGAADM